MLARNLAVDGSSETTFEALMEGAEKAVGEAPSRFRRQTT